MLSLLRLFGQAPAQIDCSNLANETGCNSNTGLPSVHATPANIQNIFQIVFGVLGAVAVIFIILSAIQLAAAQGDPAAISKARQTIIFAAIGLAVALSAELIISLLLQKI